MRPFIPACLVGLMLVAACRSVEPGPDTQLFALEADTSMDAAYKVAGQAYLDALPTMSPQLKARLKPLLQKAHQYVKALDKGQLILGATTLAEEVDAAKDLIGQVRAALAPTP